MWLYINLTVSLNINANSCVHLCTFVCRCIVCVALPKIKVRWACFLLCGCMCLNLLCLGTPTPNMRATDVGLDVPLTRGAVYHKHVTICMCCICFVGTCSCSVSTMQNVRIICNSCLVRLPNARKQTSPLRNQSNTCIKTWTSKQQCYAKLLNGNMPQSNPASRLHRMQNTKQNHPNTNR